jgi:pimeloyl-ACP methyl ester carboxylesterase
MPRAAPPPDGFASKFANVNGIRMHYVTGGSGVPVILLHGWPQTWYAWHRIMPALGARFTVVAPDLRGGGESDKPRTDSGYTKRLMAEDIHTLVAELGFDKVIVVGHDIGMMVAYAYAATHPDEIRGLVTAEAPLPGLEPLWSEMLKSPYSWHLGFHAEVDLATLLISSHVREYLTSFYAKHGRIESFLDTEINEFVRAYSEPAAVRGGCEWYRGLRTDVEEFRVLLRRKLRMPILCLCGGTDSLPYTEMIAEAIGSDSRAHPIARAGHWLAQEQPEALTSELLMFFREL